MIRTYKYRIYPNKTQKRTLGHILYCQRTIYNRALEQRITAYKETDLSLSYFDQCKSFKQVRKSSFPLVNATSMQQLLRRLDKSYQAFFRRVKNGDKAGLPRFKGVDRFHSIEFKPNDGCRIKTVEGKQKLVITHVGPIRIKWHRDLPRDSKIKHFVVSLKNEKWFVCCQVEYFQAERSSINPAIGIDLGITHLAALSNGAFIDSPKHYIAGQKRLRVLQRAVARKKKGSNSRKRAVKILAKHHGHVANQRLDFLHKTTRHIVDSFGIVVLEDLSLNFMIRNKHLAKHALDVAMGAFTSMIEYKAEDAGTQVIKVDPKLTSQICSQCGQIVKKSLSVRSHVCDCGLVMDRDTNASINILNRGASLLDDRTYRIAESVSSQAVCL